MENRVLRVRKLADNSEGRRVIQIDPETGTKTLVNPDTGNAEPWPLLGVVLLDDPPDSFEFPTTWVLRAMGEGWMSIDEPLPVVEQVGELNIVFVQGERLILHLANADLSYRITRQPGRQEDGEVLHSYIGERED